MVPKMFLYNAFFHRASINIKLGKIMSIIIIVAVIIVIGYGLFLYRQNVQGLTHNFEKIK